jgi:PAS domain S-box-containing protein
MVKLFLEWTTIMAPYQGAIYFRPHANGSMVQFHNSFWSKLDSGEVFTIDQPLLDVRTSGMTLLIDQKGNISSCDGRYCLEMQESLVDKNLFQLCPDSHSSFIANAISCAVYGKCYFNLFTKFSNDPRNVTMDFHPSVTGQVVVSVSIVRESVDAAKLPGTPDCGADGDTETRSVPSAAHGHVIPTENEVYCLGRRLRDMGAEIQYLQDYRDNVLLPMYSIKHSGHIVWANEAMIELMGFRNARDQFIGSQSTTYHVSQDCMRTMAETVLGGKPLHNFLCQITRRDGVVLDVAYNSNAKFDSNGVFSHSRCIVQDMTEQNKLRIERDEMERKQLLAELNAKEALTASRTKSDFLAVMSHEIRTPINGVIGAASLLQTTTLDEEQRDYVDTISDSADILLSLIHNILDISKIEKGKFQLDVVSL